MSQGLSVDRVSYRYGDKVALDAVSFDVAPTTPPGPQMFVLNLTDVFDNVWEDTFSINVVP